MFASKGSVHLLNLCICISSILCLILLLLSFCAAPRRRGEGRFRCSLVGTFLLLSPRFRFNFKLFALFLPAGIFSSLWLSLKYFSPVPVLFSAPPIALKFAAPLSLAVAYSVLSLCTIDCWGFAGYPSFSVCKISLSAAKDLWTPLLIGNGWVDGALGLVNQLPQFLAWSVAFTSIQPCSYFSRIKLNQQVLVHPRHFLESWTSHHS